MAKMYEAHKEIIKEFIDDDIFTINMYWGYKGDFILKITTPEPITAFAIEDFAIQELGIEAVTKQETTSGMYEVFCVAIDEEIYNTKLK